MEDKNPFSLYDFLGYLFPGALSLFILFSVYKVYSQEKIIMPIDHFNFFMGFLKGEPTNIDYIKVGIPFVIVSYILGHFFAYLSSITVEYLTTRSLNFPSKFLLSKKPVTKAGEKYWRDGTKDSWSIGNSKLVTFCKEFLEKEYSCKVGNFLMWIIDYLVKFITLPFPYIINFIPFVYNNKRDWKIWPRFIIYIAFFPITFFLLSCRSFSDFITVFITRPLKPFTVKAIEQKIKDLKNEIHIDKEIPKDDEDFDFHRIVMHYVYLNVSGSRTKTSNYVALYGFLRSTTLILCLFTDWLLFLGVKSILRNGISASVDWTNVILIAFMWVATFISYLGFVKFYRRFTLENLMSLLTGKWHNE